MLRRIAPLLWDIAMITGMAATQSWVMDRTPVWTQVIVGTILMPLLTLHLIVLATTARKTFSDRGANESP